MTAFPRLFEPGRLGKLTAPNRLIMPPMVLNYADSQGRVTDRYVAHIRRIARGGVGTIVLEASYVANDGKGFTNQLGIHTDEQLAGLRRLVDAAHAEGVLIGPQLHHAGRQTASRITGTPLFAPSALPCPLMQEVPRAMTPADIDRIVAQFAAAARRAQRAGFDFVEIHGAHGYLLMQFLSAFSNQRTDDYGGSFDNRLRFPLEVARAVRAAVGEDFTVLYRISGEEGIPGGLTLDEAAQAADALAHAGVDAIHVSVGSYGSYVQGRMIPPMSMPDAVNVELAAAIRRRVHVPVIAVGKCREPALAESLLEQGKADFIAIGRSLLADPDWPRKARAGKPQEINACIACNQGCISRLFEQLDVWCTVNPECGREQQFESRRFDGQRRRILVAGAGPAGMTAALTAARLGGEVTVFEAAATPGGQLQAAAAAPYRGEWKRFAAWLPAELARAGVEIHTGVRVTPELVKREHPDLVIVATGAQPVRVGFPNAGHVPVLHGRDVLEDRADVPGNRIVVVGGGCSGAQTAEFLTVRGCTVTVIEAGHEIASDMPMDERHLALTRLHDAGVHIYRDTRLLGITEQGVSVRGPGGDESLPADTVLFCLGAEPADELVDPLSHAGWMVTTVGDARRPRRVTDAVAEGALAVLHFLEQQRDVRRGDPGATGDTTIPRSTVLPPG